jgi:hypothetical protein
MTVHDSFTAYAPGARYANRGMHLTAGEVAEISRTPLHEVTWGAVAVLALVLASVSAVGFIGYLVAVQ